MRMNPTRYTTALAAPSAFWPAPKIELVTCWQCGGAGTVPMIRKWRAVKDRCAVCNGHGSIVSDNA